MALFMLTSHTFSQILLNEDFNASTDLPAGWTLYNVDGKTPASNISSVFTNAWVVRKNAYTGQGNHISSTSWYDPTGQADDWLVSPQVSIPNSGDFFLFFDAVAQDQNFPDGFQVYISKTGNAIADFGETPLLDVPAAPSTYTTYQIDLANYLGEDIYVAIRNNSNDKFILNVDNIIIKNLPPTAVDISLEGLYLVDYALKNTDYYIEATIKNLTSHLVSSVEIKWNNGTDHVATISDLWIDDQEDTTVVIPIPVNISEQKTESITVTVTKVNGQDDYYPFNNEKSTQTTVVSQTIQKRPLLEEGTGTWCGWCPQGIVGMEKLLDKYGDEFVGVVVHNEDPMAVNAYDKGLVDIMGHTAYPNLSADRRKRGGGTQWEPDEDGFEFAYHRRKEVAAPVSISLKNELNDNKLQINVETEWFINNPTADFRIGAIVVEDSVTGTTGGYNQANYFSYQSQNITYHGYEDLPHPIPAADMVYNRVGRALIGGFKGQVNSVPTAITDGQKVEYTFNYTIPTKFNKDNLYIVAVAIDNATGAILNARQSKVIPLPEQPEPPKEDSTITNSVNDWENINMTVYPNPATDRVSISFETDGGEHIVQIIDISGRVVLSESYTDLSGKQTVELNTSELTTGAYLVSIAKDRMSFTQTITIE